MTTSAEVIEQLVMLTHGASGAQTQHLFRQSLQVLVELAKAEERMEGLERSPAEHVARRVIH